MMSLAIFVLVAAVAVAEPPPSHSYLPPSPANRNPGFQQSFTGAPQVIAARTLDHGHHNGNGVARSGAHDQITQARLSHQGYEENSAIAALSRNAIEANSEPANYNFGYMVNDYSEGTDFGHHEERVEERAQGEYHVVLPDGRKQTVSYEADERGFKPQISYQDTEDLARSNGYDATAHNHGNGYDATARNGGNGYDATARNGGNGYDATARNHGNGIHDDHDSRANY